MTREIASTSRKSRFVKCERVNDSVKCKLKLIEMLMRIVSEIVLMMLNFILSVIRIVMMVRMMVSMFSSVMRVIKTSSVKMSVAKTVNARDIVIEFIVF